MEKNTKASKNLNRLIKVRVISSKGHDEWEELPEIALSKIQTETAGGKKWLYIDNKPVNPDSLTLDQLLDAEYIILTNALVGGLEG